MESPTIDIIRASIGAQTEDHSFTEPPAGAAAVALILAGPGTDLSLCFIRRADREGDPWSGHMAFPGGRADPSDRTNTAVAERETLEEVGIHLDTPAFIGSLPRMAIRRGRTDTGLALSSFVYYIGPDLLPLLPNHEVADAYWIPFNHLWDSTNSSTFELLSGAVPAAYTAISYKGNLIWGLSYRVLSVFGQVIGFPLPDPLNP